MTDIKPRQPGAAPQSRVTTKGGALIGTVGLAAAALLSTFVSGWENGLKGPALVPYRDIVGV